MDLPQPPQDNDLRNIIDKLAQFVASKCLLLNCQHDISGENLNYSVIDMTHNLTLVSN